jgi:6,7-dimethyl-8-ribityllumazine synthase
MASALHNLSDYDFASVPNAADMKFGIVVSEWNSKITGALLQGAFDTLTLHGAKEENIFVKTVPGSFELVFGAASLVKSGKVDAVIAIGCVIKGDTPHFDYICEGTTYGLARLNATQSKPVIYGLITTNDMQQALDRCGGKMGNKGDECAVAAIKMIALSRRLSK